MSAPLTIWNPIKVYKALRWDAAISAEEYLRANTSLFVLTMLFIFCGIFAGIGFGYFGATFGFDVKEILENSDSSFHASYFLNQGIAFYGMMIPVILMILFTTLYMIKLSVLRLHAFNLSGWWLLGIIGMFLFLDYFGMELLSIFLYSVVSFVSYFYSKKQISRWQYYGFFKDAPKGFENFVIGLFAVFVWFGILGDPLFILIDMI